MGQGTYTSMPMLIAEELEVDLSQVHLEHAPPDDARYANPLIGFQVTGGSTSVRAAWTPLRRAGATARTMLVSAAAQAWQVDPTTCRAEKGTVTHVPTGRTLRYGALVDAAATLPVPATVALKGPAEFKLIGSPAKRLDTPAKVNGRAQYSIDVRLPGMRIATVATCPVFGGTLAGVDDRKARAIKGVRQVVRLDNAVAVIGDHMWAAKQGLARAQHPVERGPVRPAQHGRHRPGSSRARPRPPAWSRARTGDVAGAMASAATKVEAVYQLPFLAHATMEPVNCTVHVRPDGCDIWVGTQVAQPGAGGCRRVDRPSAGEGPGAQPPAGRRFRPAARGGLRRPGGARSRSKWTARSRSCGPARRTSSTTCTGPPTTTASPRASTGRAGRSPGAIA